MKRALLLMLIVLLSVGGCQKKEAPTESKTTIVFKHGKIAGDPALFRELIDEFERISPDITVRDEALPASTDEQHQFYVINLEGKSSEFDVFAMDVIWVQEFARAGWLRNLSSLLPPLDRQGFFPGPMQAVTYEGEIYAVPWYIDAGLLYYRKDLLDKYGFQPPKTWKELVDTARAITGKEPGMYGFIWQGKQYEGLVCNVLEYMWSNGGDVLQDGKVVIDSPENAEALRFMRQLIVKYGVTPELVTTAIEEPTRHIFGNGDAVFLRNWPYAWNIFEREGSAVRGKVGVSVLPAFEGGTPAATLGGWQLGVNKYSKHPLAAQKFISFMTSPAAQKKLALSIGYKPTRKSLYKDKDLQREQPFIAGLYDVFMHARPRPVTPYYMMMTQVMQPEFSAAISGTKPPERALADAQREMTRILESTK